MANELAGATVASPQPAPLAAAPSLPSPFADIASGAMPAITLAPIEDQKTDPAQEFTVANFDALAAAGIEYHEIPESSESVLFNPSKVTPEQINEAYAAGKLHELAPVVRDLAGVGTTVAPEGAGAPTATQSGPLAGATAGAPTDGALKTARLRNVAPAPQNAPNPVPGQLAKRSF